MQKQPLYQHTTPHFSTFKPTQHGCFDESANPHAKHNLNQMRNV